MSLRDVWENGTAYERYVGRWSRQLARDFLNWLTVPESRAWLDVGCGTGALAHTIAAHHSPQRIELFDHSPLFLAMALEQLKFRRANATVGDAQALPFASETFDAVVSGLALNFVRDPSSAARGMARAARRGGVVAAYVWDYAGTMQFMQHFWDAAVALNPDASDLDEGRRFAICHPEPLTRLFQSAELQDVQVRALDLVTRFLDYDDYWQPFLGGQGSAPTYLMSLSQDRQAALRDAVHARLPIAPDGSITLAARAWAVRGTR